MGSKTKLAVWIVVGVVILAGAVWYVASRNGARAPGTAGGPTGTLPGVPSFASTGQLISGFPQSLILDAGTTASPAIDSSYTINYSTTTNQFTAEWTSSSSMLTVYADYKHYLAANGWTITNDDTKYPNLRVLYATNTSSSVSADIVEQGNGSAVSVTYLVK